MTHPHEGLQEPALREALRKSVEGWRNAIEFGIIPPQHRTAAQILADEGAAALSAIPTPPIHQDQGLRDALCKIIEANCPRIDPFTHTAIGSQVEALADAILAALPQQAATDEGEKERARKLLADLDALLGKPIRTGPVAEDAFKLILSALSTPTAQPPAAETRLREVAKDALTFTCMTIAFIGRDQGSPRVDDMLNGICKLAVELEPKLRAALTQPEPTAQQATDEGAQPSGTFSCPICGKDTPHYHRHQEVDEHNETEAWVEESLQKFRALEAEQKSAQQAAGEAEAVAWTEERKFYRSEWTTNQLLAARNGGLQADPGEAWIYRYSHKDAKGEYDLLYRPVATPQPTETVEELGQRAHYDECQALLTKHGVKPTLAESNTGPATIHSVGIVNAMLEFANRHRIAAQPTETKRIVAWMEKEAADCRAMLDRGCSEEMAPLYLMRAGYYDQAASMIGRGVHLTADLAGEGQ